MKGGDFGSDYLPTLDSFTKISNLTGKALRTAMGKKVRDVESGKIERYKEENQNKIGHRRLNSGQKNNNPTLQKTGSDPLGSDNNRSFGSWEESPQESGSFETETSKMCKWNAVYCEEHDPEGKTEFCDICMKKDKSPRASKKTTNESPMISTSSADAWVAREEAQRKKIAAVVRDAKYWYEHDNYWDAWRLYNDALKMGPPRDLENDIANARADAAEEGCANNIQVLCEMEARD